MEWTSLMTSIITSTYIGFLLIWCLLLGPLENRNLPDATPRIRWLTTVWTSSDNGIILSHIKTFRKKLRPLYDLEVIISGISWSNFLFAFCIIQKDRSNFKNYPMEKWNHFQAFYLKVERGQPRVRGYLKRVHGYEGNLRALWVLLLSLAHCYTIGALYIKIYPITARISQH